MLIRWSVCWLKENKKLGQRPKEKKNKENVLIKKINLYICSPLEIADFFLTKKVVKADVAQLARAADL